jgi:hypothetical protein
MFADRFYLVTFNMVKKNSEVIMHLILTIIIDR